MKKKNCKNGNNKDLYNKDINININTKSFDKLSLALSRMKEGVGESIKQHADIIQKESMKKTPYVPTGSLGYLNTPFFPFVPSDLNLHDGDDLDTERERLGLPPFNGGLVTEWSIDIAEEKKNKSYLPKLGESRNIEVNYTIEDPKFLEWLEDISRRNNDMVALNSEKDPRTKGFFLPAIKNTKWVIDDLVPEDTILCFDKRDVTFGVDKDGKEFVKLRNKKNFKKIYLGKNENKNE